jgi:hypothetical protein
MLFWHSSFAFKLYLKKAKKTSKNVQPLHCSSTIRHPRYVRYKAPHMHNNVSATFVHGDVVVGTARDVLWEHCQQGVCNARSGTHAVAPTYYSSSSSCRHSSHSGLAPSDGRIAVFGEFCLMYTSFSARSRLKRLRLAVDVAP